MEDGLCFDYNVINSGNPDQSASAVRNEIAKIIRNAQTILLKEKDFSEVKIL